MAACKHATDGWMPGTRVGFVTAIPTGAPVPVPVSEPKQELEGSGEGREQGKGLGPGCGAAPYTSPSSSAGPPGADGDTLHTEVLSRGNQLLSRSAVETDTTREL